MRSACSAPSLSHLSAYWWKNTILFDGLTWYDDLDGVPPDGIAIDNRLAVGLIGAGDLAHVVATSKAGVVPELVADDLAADVSAAIVPHLGRVSAASRPCAIELVVEIVGLPVRQVLADRELAVGLVAAGLDEAHDLNAARRASSRDCRAWRSPTRRSC